MRLIYKHGLPSSVLAQFLQERVMVQSLPMMYSVKFCLRGEKPREKPVAVSPAGVLVVIAPKPRYYCPTFWVVPLVACFMISRG
jgi:hypothetical protein